MQNLISKELEPGYQFDKVLNSSNRDITAWVWDFGDGTSASGQNVVHECGSGTYTICLTLIGKDAGGLLHRDCMS